ncbi:Uncharacterised protein [Candidatus Tiddalikarchaeum anstoanum]|nr:Uncharacterised protein [Candidatus Tiddalikarchaeum anstoanum]
MEFTKVKLEIINELLNDIKEDKSSFERVLSEVCPNEDCDPQLESNSDAKKCKYFTLCNSLGSYCFMDDEEREYADQFLEGLYEAMKRRKDGKNDASFYM